MCIQKGGETGPSPTPTRRVGGVEGACLAEGRTTFDDSFIAEPVASDSERRVGMTVDLLLI